MKAEELVPGEVAFGSTSNQLARQILPNHSKCQEDRRDVQ